MASPRKGWKSADRLIQVLHCEGRCFPSPAWHLPLGPFGWAPPSRIPGHIKAPKDSAGLKLSSVNSSTAVFIEIFEKFA